MMNAERRREIAERTASALFSDGQGNRADRLVMVSPSGDALGVFSPGPVEDRIFAALREATKEYDDQLEDLNAQLQVTSAKRDAFVEAIRHAYRATVILSGDMGVESGQEGRTSAEQ